MQNSSTQRCQNPALRAANACKQLSHDAKTRHRDVVVSHHLITLHATYDFPSLLNCGLASLKRPADVKTAALRRSVPTGPSRSIATVQLTLHCQVLKKSQ